MVKLKPFKGFRIPCYKMRTRSNTNGIGLYDIYIEQTIPSFHLCSYSDMCCDRPTASLWIRTHKPILVVFSSALAYTLNMHHSDWHIKHDRTLWALDIGENESEVHSTEPTQSRG